MAWTGCGQNLRRGCLLQAVGVGWQYEALVR